MDTTRGMQFCPNCGTQIHPSARFCSQCGTPLQRLIDSQILGGTLGQLLNSPVPESGTLAQFSNPHLSFSLQQKLEERAERQAEHHRSSGTSTPLVATHTIPRVVSNTPSILGKDIETDQDVTLEQEARQRGLYVIGKTGSGKTTLLINLILQDIEQGMGLCFFDTHGDAITDILKRLPAHREHDVILLELLDKSSAFGLNLFACDDPTNHEQVSLTVNYVMEVFQKLFIKEGDLAQEAPNMAQTVQNAAFALIANPGMTMAEIPLLLQDETARGKLTEKVTNAFVWRWWKTYDSWRTDKQMEMSGSTLTRVSNFLADPLNLHIFGQSKSTIDFRRIMDERKILLVKLSRRHTQMTSLVGSVIIGQIASAAFSREDTPEVERVQFNLYADEYQRFATPTFAELLTEMRKYKIATCVAHQARGQLDGENRVATLNAANLVVYQVSGEDADELAKQVFNVTPQAAWEEELKEEWFEPKIDVIEDGEEELKTPVSTPFDWLLSHTHNNPVVNRFVDERLREIHIAQTMRKYNEEIVKNAIQAQLDLNQLFHHAMTKSLHALCEPSGILALLSFNEVCSLASLNFYHYFGYAMWADWKFHIQQQEHYTSYNPHLHHEFNSMLISDRMADFSPDRAFRNEVQNIDLQMIAPFRRLIISSDFQGFAQLTQAKLNRLREDFIQRCKSQIYGKGAEEIQKQKIEASRVFVQQVMVEERAQFETFIRELREFVLALAKEPITSGSGVSQPHKRTQIHYLTHPRKSITHPQRTYADMEEEGAKQLVNPKEYTARCKLGTREYSILPEKTEQFRPAAAPSLVQARQERIRLLNYQEGYTRNREEVVQEITARQDELMKRVQKQTRIKTEEVEDEPATKLSPVQQKKLESIRKVLGQKDYDRFYNDPSVQYQDNLKRLLDKNVPCRTD